MAVLTLDSATAAAEAWDRLEGKLLELRSAVFELLDEDSDPAA